MVVDDRLVQVTLSISRALVHITAVERFFVGNFGLFLFETLLVCQVWQIEQQL